jgi:hypothetical protein
MKVGLAAAAAFAAFLLGGCISVNETVLAEESLSVEVIDSGWYIFGCIPVLSGNPDGVWPHWFTDDLDPRTTMKVLDRIIARENPDSIGPIVTYRRDETVLVLITRMSYHTSAIIPAKGKREGIKEQDQK